jgi:hypothetical protein
MYARGRAEISEEESSVKLSGAENVVLWEAGGMENENKIIKNMKMMLMNIIKMQFLHESISLRVMTRSCSHGLHPQLLSHFLYHFCCGWCIVVLKVG